MMRWRHKQPSRRRWKARCLLGQPIPHFAVMEHNLLGWISERCGYSVLEDAWRFEDPEYLFEEWTL